MAKHSPSEGLHLLPQGWHANGPPPQPPSLTSTRSGEVELNLSIAGARRRDEDRRGLKELLDELGALRRPGELLQAFDARSIAGPRHLASAFLHAKRAREEGRARLKDAGALFALYLSGEDQFGRALARVGLKEETRELVLVASPRRNLDAVLDALQLVKSLQSLPRTHVPSELLALERIALLDIKLNLATKVARSR